eukprot:TRINITY_DN230_c0_g1_i3.p1 TRINITY_DN230_c0_g1~~TRINITY_DN230_c0_g1_i3.p1  ORF type:complete len:1423 (+),score=511.71 TRINITY_DN230_c0_g1_i3:51-4319(+)
MTLEDKPEATPQGEPQTQLSSEPIAEEAPVDVEEAKADEGWKTGERFYVHGSCFVDYEGFRECPMGRDILGGEPFDCEALCEKAFLKLMTREEYETVGDVWALQAMADTGTPWKFLSPLEKVETVVVNFVKFCSIWGVLYMFIISLGLMGNAFKILGGKSSGRAFRESELLSNPVAGLAIGILATVLMQSSSTTTSIVISMAAAELVSVEDAAYLVMGANIGTSVTNTIVSIAHLNSPAEYRRAFTGAVFHDMFNWLTVGMFLPLEAASGFLKELAGEAVDSMNLSTDKREKVEFIKKITKPASGRVVSVDKKLIEKIAQASSNDEVKKLEKKTIIKQKSGHVLRDTPISDDDAGVLLLFVSLTMLTTCLLLLVKLLQSVLKGGVASWTRYFLNIDFKHPILRSCGGLDNYILMIFGTGCTILVQSSSVFTSTLTPLVGIGLIHIEKLVALTHGANIGTTVTGVLSALSSDNVVIGMRVALEHVFFNVLGTVVWFFIWPLRPVPLALAKFMGDTAANLRWFPVAYILLAFLAMPGLVIALSIAGWEVLVAVGVPVAIIVFSILVLIWVRRNRADLLTRGSILRAEELCGKKLPNFMQLWGGDLEKDKVDMEEMRLKEEEAKRIAATVSDWPQSAGAWGLCILAFVAMTLALPTSQWRRMRYAQEERGRKEFGLGLWEMCSDDFKKDHSFASVPQDCNATFVAQCASELELSCAAGYESDDVYSNAWARCTQAGCRSHAWSVECPEIRSCKERTGHAERCMKPIKSFTFQVLEQEQNGAAWDFSLANEVSTGDVNVLPHDNHFVDSASEKGKLTSYTLPAQPLAGTVNPDLTATLTCTDCDQPCETGTGDFCNDAPGLSGVTFDHCSGDLYAMTGRGPAAACNGATVLALKGFSPAVGKLKLGNAYTSNSTSTVVHVDSWANLKYNGNSVSAGLSTTDNEITRIASAAWTVATCPANTVVDTPTTFGLNMGDVQAFNNGMFIGADQFGPEIAIWNAAGEIQAIYTTDAAALGGGANVKAVIPAIYRQRHNGRGFGSVAVNADKDKIVACLESPLTGGDAALLNSNAVRCIMLNVTDYANPSVIMQKVVLLSDAQGEYSAALKNTTNTQADVRFKAAAWLKDDKVLLMETAKSGSANVSITLREADFSTGTDIASTATLDAIERVVVSGGALVLNPAVDLAAAGVVAVTTKKVFDVGSLEGVEEKIGDSVEGMFIANSHTVVLAESGNFAAPSKVHVVQMDVTLSDFSAPKCAFPKTSTFEGGDNCRKIGDVCPKGDLEGDMETVAGLAVSGTLFLGIGMVAVVLYSFLPHHAVFGKMIFVSAAFLTLAWILVLAAWAHTNQMSTNTYGCLFLDESARSESRGGGMALLHGELQYITRPSYSWAFTIYAWGMLTISLCFVLHRVVRETVMPYPAEENLSAKERQ